jgi:hypothetical protein
MGTCNIICCISQNEQLNKCTKDLKKIKKNKQHIKEKKNDNDFIESIPIISIDSNSSLYKNEDDYESESKSLSQISIIVPNEKETESKLIQNEKNKVSKIQEKFKEAYKNSIIIPTK